MSMQPFSNPSPQFGGNYTGPEDGNFKRGAFKPIAIIVGLLLVAGVVVIVLLSIKGEQEKMSADAIAKEKNDIQLLPMKDQMPKWRAWAANDAEPHLQQEAFARLAWAHDPQGLDLIIKGLSASDHSIRGTAATALLEYGSPAADKAKPTLLKALAEAQDADKPQICWALAALHEPTAFDAVLAEYRLGHLSQVQKLDGSPAFDAEEMAKMVSLDKLATMAGDDSPSVRQLVATTLARTGDAKWTSTLTKLVTDKETEVGAQAAVGLGKIANEDSMKPLLAALSHSDKDLRVKFIQALRDGVGAKGLVLALKSVSHDKWSDEKFQTKQIFDMLADLEDPRGGDALVEYLASNPKPHWKTEAAMRLAEVGDVRAAPYLGDRMKQDPLKIYNDVEFPELRRDDNERVFAARMLSDLAIIHPEKKDELRKGAEEGVLYWIDPANKPWPHANGLRFLAASGSTKFLPELRHWADPTDPLPKIGQQPPFPDVWATSQSALRYLGWTQDPAGWSILTKQLNRKDQKTDASWESLYQGGMTILGMTLRALGVGASDGFAQWGDPKAYSQLVTYIEDPKENEQSRTEACFALSWVANDDNMKDVVKKVHDAAQGSDKKAEFLRQCYLETLIHRPVPDATAGLVDLISNTIPDIETRNQAARAIGFGGITQAMIPAIFDKLKDINLKAPAALALLLGADSDTAMRAIATYNDADPTAIEELKDLYNKTFGYWSDKNYENGDVARWVANAEAVEHVKVHDTLQEWPKLILSRNIVDSIEIDNGPHSITRVQMRWRLLQDAKGTNDVKRQNAIEILKFMKEKGVLMALRNEQGPVAELARKAFFEVMNPKVSVEHLPDAPRAQSGQDPNAMPPGGGANVVPH